MNLETEVQKAGEARQILDSSMFQAAKADIEGHLAHARRSVPLKDSDMHTRLIMMEQLWGSLIGYFENIAMTGKMADIQLREAEERRSLLERGVALFRAQGRNF